MKTQTRYYIFILSRLISTLGNWFASMAIPFMIYDITESALAISISFLLETLPIILLAKKISFVIDNCSRKIILQLCEIVSAVSLILCIITDCSNIYLLYAMCMCLSITSFTYNNTVNSYIPDICGGMELKRANTLDSFAGNISMVLAPIVAGWSVKQYGYSFALKVDIITFVLSIMLLQFLKQDKREEDLKNEDEEKKERWLGECRRILLGDKVLKSVIIIAIMFSVCGAIFSSLDAVYIAEIFNGSSDVYGYINSAWGIGMLVASSLYFLYKDISEITMFSFGILMMGTATIGYGISLSVTTCILFNFLGGISNTIYVVYYKSLIQSRTVSTNRGKVFTMQSILSKIISMLIVFLAGGIADLFTVRITIVFSGIITILIAFFSFRIEIKKN